MEGVYFAETFARLENVESVPALDPAADLAVAPVHLAGAVSLVGQHVQRPLYRRGNGRPFSRVVTRRLEKWDVSWMSSFTC